MPAVRLDKWSVFRFLYRGIREKSMARKKHEAEKKHALRKKEAPYVQDMPDETEHPALS